MYIQATNHYSLNDEERKALHTMEKVLDTLSDGITYGRDDHYVAGDYHINQDDIDRASRLVMALVSNDYYTIEDHVLVAD